MLENVYKNENIYDNIIIYHESLAHFTLDFFLSLWYFNFF